MRKYVINGSFLVEKLAGVQRYAYEIIKKLDEILPNDCNIEILVPDENDSKQERKNRENLYKRIRVIHRGNAGGKKWEHTVFAPYVKSNQAKAISLCNFYPLNLKGGIVAIHDICFKTHPEYFIQKGDWREIMIRKMMYKRAFKYADKVITVSEFSKKEILNNYKVKSGEIEVIGNAWQHYNTEDIDESIFERLALPKDKKEQYYFFLSSLAPNKNLKWILENAREHPDDIYVLSGNMLGDDSGVEKLNNVIYAGYVTDAQARALYKHCKAFVFPSTYEGFGIPPMEALSMGAQVVAADIECLHGVYADALHYFDPYNPHVDIDTILQTEVTPAKDILNKYSWEKSAKKLRDIMMY